MSLNPAAGDSGQQMLSSLSNSEVDRSRASEAPGCDNKAPAMDFPSHGHWEPRLYRLCHYKNMQVCGNIGAFAWRGSSIINIIVWISKGTYFHF